MFGKKQSAEPAKVTSTSLAEESAKIIDVFEKAVTNLKEVASRAQAEKEVREQEIIELQKTGKDVGKLLQLGVTKDNIPTTKDKRRKLLEELMLGSLKSK